jgi:hypothetical protein
LLDRFIGLFKEMRAAEPHEKEQLEAELTIVVNALRKTLPDPD